MFQRFRDFLCKRAGTYDYSTTGIGWTLHDAVYAIDENTLSSGDYFVVYSPGESGDDDMYIKFTYGTAGTWLYSRGFLYWDNATHAGVLSFPSTDYDVMPAGSGYKLWVYGDLSTFAAVQYNGAYYGGWWGKSENLLYSDTVATSSAAVGTGTDVVITLDAVPATWQVGQALFIRDTVTAKKIVIKAIAGLDITADITTAMAAGCKLQADWSFFVSGQNNFYAYQYGIAAHDGTFGGSSAYATGSAPTLITGSAAPDTMNGDIPAARIDLYDTTPDAYYGTLRNIFSVKNTGRVDEEVLVTKEGGQYRYFYLYSLKPVVFMEV